MPPNIIQAPVIKIRWTSPGCHFYCHFPWMWIKTSNWKWKKSGVVELERKRWSYSKTVTLHTNGGPTNCFGTAGLILGLGHMFNKHKGNAVIASKSCKILDLHTPTQTSVWAGQSSDMPLYSGRIYSNYVHKGLYSLRDCPSLPLRLKFIFKVFLMLGFWNWLQLSSNSDHMWGVLCKYCTTGSLLYISVSTFIQSANMIRRKNGTKPVVSTISQEYLEQSCGGTGKFGV